VKCEAWSRGKNVNKPGKWNFLYSYCSPACAYLSAEREKYKEIVTKERKKLDKEVERLQKKMEKQQQHSQKSKKMSKKGSAFLTFAGDRKKY
jgi:hypothetical protein